MNSDTKVVIENQLEKTQIIIKMKRLFLMSILLVFAICCFGESVTIVKNSAKEYIRDKFDGTSKYWVTELKIVGELNGKDVQFIREIATSESEGNLTKLDLSEASFVDVDALDEVFGNITLDKDLWNSTLADNLQGHFHKLYDSYSSEKHHSYFFGYYVVWREFPSDCVRIYEIEKFDVNCLSGHFFDGCDKLTSVILPPNTTGICDGAFTGCVNLKELNIPDKVAFIGDGAFNECSSLTSINLPTSVSYIGSDAFNKCKGLTSMDLSFVKQLGSYSFNECSNLESVKLCEQMTEIPFSAFYDCRELAKVNIPKATEKIGSYAFEHCNLEEVTIPENVTLIGVNSFLWCPLKKIYALSKSPCSCETNPFSGFDVANNCILYVPKGCIERYSLSPGWSVFQNIKEISDGDILPQCPTPTISYIDGSIIFSSSLSTANYHYTITTPDSKSGIASDGVELFGYYNIIVFASSDGYRDSETIHAKLYWIDASLNSPSDINKFLASKRPLIISCSNGTIQITGLNNDEEVFVYSLSGAELHQLKAINGTIQFYTDEKIVLIKVAESTIKLMNH